MPETVGKPERDADIMQLLVVLNAECFAGSELRPEKRILQSGFQTPTLIQFLAERESHDDGGMMLLVLNNPAAVILGNLHESDGNLFPEYPADSGCADKNNTLPTY